ncbi:MAG: DUF2905 domain-containing protein [Spirochaetota bacterium]
MQKLLIIVGVIIVATGIAWPWLSKLPLGRLPGDIAIERENMKFYFPLMTSLLLSLLLSLVLWLFRRF